MPGERDGSEPGLPPALVGPEEGLAVLAQPVAPGRTAGRRWARAGLLVAPATLVANVLGYGFNVLVSRHLGPDGYGALGALLGLVLVGSVPGLALQAVLARRLAVGGFAPSASLVHGLRSVVLGAAVATGAVAAALTPAVAAYLHLPGPAAVLWLAASLVPLTLVSAQQGVLQGSEAFGRLSVLFVAAALLRLLGGLVAVGLGGSVADVLLGTAAGYCLAAVCGQLLVRSLLADDADADPAAGAGALREVLASGLGLVSLVVLTNLDVLLARHHLPERAAGIYAVGAVLAKGAFWAPQVVVVLVFPRLAGSQSGSVLRRALGGVALFGLAATVVTELAARPLLRIVFGPEYSGLAGTAWAFTALGSLLALAQLLVFSGIASRDRRPGLLVLLVAVVEAVLVSAVLHDTVGQVVGAALVAAALLVLVGTVLALSGRATRSAPAPSGRP